MFITVKSSRFSLGFCLALVSLVVSGCSTRPPHSEERATPTVSRSPAEKWSLAFLETEKGVPISVQVGADGAAVYRRSGQQEVQLRMQLSSARLGEFEQAIRSLPPTSLGSSPTPNATSQITVQSEGKSQVLHDDAPQLTKLLRELEPRPYARDREDAWLCGSLEEGPENGIFLSITPESKGKTLYRLEPTPNIDRKDDVILMVAGKIDTRAVDTSMAGPTYNVTSWARLDASPNQKAASATPASTSAKP